MFIKFKKSLRRVRDVKSFRETILENVNSLTELENILWFNSYAGDK